MSLNDSKQNTSDREVHTSENISSRPKTKWLWRIFLLNLVLVGFHLGEFWPFSIFPMFSKAGQPWSRAMIVEAPLNQDTLGESPEVWEPLDINILNLQAVSLGERGIDKIDFSNYVGKTARWTPEIVAGVGKMIPDRPDSDRAWLVLKVRGQMTDGKVTVKGEPMVALTADTVVASPTLTQNEERP
jgi:hypothetical protein